MKNQTAIITGISGQDGALLAQYLILKNYKIVAPVRKSSDLKNLVQLGISTHQNIQFVEFISWNCFESLIKEYQADEFYHLAALSHVGESHKNPEKTFDVNLIWTINILKYINIYSTHTRLFFASSCEIFDNSSELPVSETDLKNPDNPYGISKFAAQSMVEYYRETQGIFACCGILFNHESELRGDNFVSKKICKEAARIVKYGGQPLFLGNIEAKKDWGYALDYIPYFHKMLQQEHAANYILSSSELHSVKQLVESAFNALSYEIRWQGEGKNTVALNNKNELVVAVDEKFFRPTDSRYLIGNNQKARSKLDFNNLTPFSAWIEKMVKSEYNKLL